MDSQTSKQQNMASVNRASSSLIKVVALSGSLRKGSYNTALIRSGIELSKGEVEGIEIEYIDISDLPFLNTDLEKDGSYPSEVEAFRQKIVAADSVLFASPEYNYSVTGPLKNAIDWASRPPNVWAGKAAAIVSAGGGHGGAKSQYHLRQIGVFLDLHFINKPEFFLNVFQPPPKFNSDGDLIDEDVKNRLKEILLSLKEFTLRLKGKN
ncbi:NADPH:quinone oxidoreductase-like [Vigna umbellata]|uniref:NADPH:quinone oxidoreductase-like n=1 Tax=Vigna umbellata TaxID=87088 RepID=UPI001F5E7DB1|nr:NADPH:quinone oxidoreductase-like [Vigna umbellata]